jgi:hypothetical protein
MLLASRVALTATFDGAPRPDTFVGSLGTDDIRERGGDNLSSAGGIDRVRGDWGGDTGSGRLGEIPDRRERVEGDGGNGPVSGQGDQRTK